MIANCYTLVGDLVASRQIHKRASVAAQVERAIQTVNGRFATLWIARMETTRGLDEVSAVLETSGPAFDVIVAINLHVWPAQFRFALADGRLDVGRQGDRAGDFDGPAFHRASDALKRARTEKRPLALNLQGVDTGVLRLVEETAQLHHIIMASWTPRAAEAVHLVREPASDGDNLTQEEIATRLNISQPAVSKRFRQAHHSELVASEAAIRAWLEHCSEAKP